MRIGLFGGSFDPPHVCHTLATLWALQTQELDELWWLPTHQHAFGKALVSYEDRVRMCQIATRDLSRVRICTIERELGGESRTIDTVRALTTRHPDHRYSLIVGTDILTERHKWKDWEGLMQLVSLIIVGRGGHMEALEQYEREQSSARSAATHVTGEGAPQFALPQVSSTAIREALHQGDHDASILRDWVAREVVEYVRDNRLYQMES